MRALLVVALLAVSAPAFAQSSDPKWLHAVIAASMVTHGADLSATSWAFGKDPVRFHEANPLLRPFAGDPVALGVAKMGFAVGVNTLLLKFHERKPKTVLFVAIAETIAVGYVAQHNAQLVRR